MVGEKVERLITVNLSKAYNKPTTKRAKRAIDLLRLIVAKNMKMRDGIIAISNAVSNKVVGGRYEHPLRLIKIKAIAEAGKVIVLLPEEKLSTEKKEEKLEKTEVKKEEKKETTEKTEKHIGGERKAQGKEEEEETNTVKEKERHELNKMKKG